MKFDFLVIGSGIAGLSYALKVATAKPNKTIVIITKKNAEESNTKYAQGGIAAVWDMLNDSYQKHIEDTLKAGDYACDRGVVEMVVKQSTERLKELIKWGVDFDKDKNGEYDLALEGGHTSSRIFHHKDITGLEIQKSLLKKIRSLKNITILEEHFAMDLITEHHLDTADKINPIEKIKKPESISWENAKVTCFGSYALNLKTQKIDKILAKVTLLATGGVGQIYRRTVNPAIATGDGIAMAYRAKASIEDMEFVQFHPTSLFNRDDQTAFLISEAVRGFGAYLKNSKGVRFVFDYDQRGELASRDIVARAIDSELKKTGEEYVYLDCTHIDQVEFANHFPNIKEKCNSIGIDVAKDMVPVVPSSHYICGGVSVDRSARTTIKNLYASGECAYTGLHGANRLASNSLLEGLVYSHQAYLDSIKEISKINFRKNIANWKEDGVLEPKELVLITHDKRELQFTMSDFVGIVRTDDRLKKAQKRIELLYQETENLYRTTKVSLQLLELRNMIAVSHLIVCQSLERRKNKGGYYNSDLI